MKTYRSLTQEEIQQLKERSCTAVDWDEIEVVENFKTDYIYHTRFSGKRERFRMFHLQSLCIFQALHLLFC